MNEVKKLFLPGVVRLYRGFIDVYSYCAVKRGFAPVHGLDSSRPAVPELGHAGQ